MLRPLNIALILSLGFSIHSAQAEDVKKLDEPAKSEIKQDETKQESPKKLEAKVPEDFVEHKVADSKLTIKTPPKWTEKPATGGLILNLISEDGVSNVNIVKVGVPPTRDPKIIVDEVSKAISQQIANFKLKSSDYIEVDGVGCARLSYEGDVQGLHLRWQQTMVIKTSHSFIVTFTATPEKFETYKETLDQMLVSLKIDE